MANPLKSKIMTSQKIKICVITGYGINCEKEMALACEMAGGAVSFIHAQQLLSNDTSWMDANLIAFPGGFSFGDELGAAKAFANRISYNAMNLRDRLHSFVENGNCIIGICNGFQLLVKLGLLPGNENFSQSISLANNSSSRFECRWVHHKVLPSPCIFTRGIESLYLPARHGEGNLTGSSENITNLFKNKQVALQYANEDGTVADHFPANPNGSTEAIAGLCDPTGRIFGMMAHPEAAVHFTNDPRWTRLKEHHQRHKEPVPKYGPGFAVFKNAIHYLKESQ